MSAAVAAILEADLSRVTCHDDWKHKKTTRFARSYLPKNLATNKEYSGVNRLLLTAAARGRDKVDYSHFWATYNQWFRFGCRVRAGEKGTRVYFGKRLYHTVYNLEQVVIPMNPGPELEKAIDELVRLEEDRAKEDGKLTHDEWQAYRWGMIRTARGED